MKKRKPQTRRLKKRQNESRFRYSLLLLLCGSILGTGFFFAARQHFSSMDYGMRNSRLRKQIDELEAEKRRLLLAKETSLSPRELRKTARKLGFSETHAEQTELALAAKTDTAKQAEPAKTSNARPDIAVPVRISAVEKEAKIGKQNRKEPPARKQGEITLTTTIAGIRK